MRLYRGHLASPMVRIRNVPQWLWRVNRNLRTGISFGTGSVGILGIGCWRRTFAMLVTGFRPERGFYSFLKLFHRAEPLFGTLKGEQVFGVAKMKVELEQHEIGTYVRKLVRGFKRMGHH